MSASFAVDIERPLRYLMELLGCARRGVSGVLSPEIRLCGAEFPFEGSSLHVPRVVPGRAPRNRRLRTPSDPEGSSGK